ncbi:S-formylglutathione hydrolase [Rhodobacteraceae bacterium RKSG542]|uniref:S-formylglutathione hydrolase n=1 Tax=Pseudovibrio flavus TaxID=2529854 RepID=UPI0012BCAFFC|nr:S-formylglutathione hydrolase [Pseudovibrio flavus]MTI19179.1 S-formylglutathione hydrolase [Pseudovibrio flavus]
MIDLVSKYRCFDGEQRVYRHQSTATGTPMEFAVYLPRKALEGHYCASVVYLSGLTCTWENVVTKAGAQAACAELGLIFVAPDTSPRGEDVADDEAYDLGQGAGFYINATQAPWSEHYKMETYVARELTRIMSDNFPVELSAIGIMGHSMGGHGAITLALKYPELFRSVSAFSPIVNPCDVPWGRKAFTAYLGSDEAVWRGHDSCALIKEKGFQGPMLVDQGGRDTFIEEQLQPWALEKACREAGIDLTLRLQAGYDHSYYFVSTFISEHLGWHSANLT